MTKAQKQEQEQARERLRAMLPPGSTVYTTVKHVSRSGMQREIACHAIQDGRMVWLSGLIAQACGMRLGKRDGLIIGVCGMDTGFAIVYELSHALYPAGYGCIGDRQTGHRQHTAATCPGRPCSTECDHVESYTSRRECPSNDHSNGDRDYTPHVEDPIRCAVCGEVYPCSVQQEPQRYLATAVAAHVAGKNKAHWHKSGSYALRQEWL